MGIFWKKKELPHCIECDAELDASAKFCPVCGAAQEKTNQNRPCCNCGKELSVDTIFCDNCGTKQNDFYAEKAEIYAVLEKVAKAYEDGNLTFISYKEIKNKKIQSLQDEYEGIITDDNFIMCVENKDGGIGNTLLFLTDYIFCDFRPNRFLERYKEINAVIDYSGSIGVGDYGNFYYIDFWEVISNPDGCLELWRKSIEEVVKIAKSYDFISATPEEEDEDTFQDGEDDNSIDTNSGGEDAQVVTDMSNGKRAKMQELLKNAWDIMKKGEYVPFEEMGERKKNLYKFDGNIDFDSVIGLFDISISLSLKDIWNGNQQTPCKEGLLFTLSGVYDRWGPNAGSKYIRYSDIRTMEVEDRKDGALVINNGQYTIDGVSWYTETLKELLEKICELNNGENSFSEVINSGKRKGIVSAAMRQYGYERELMAYQRCSREYEIKFRRQGDLFLQKTKDWEENRDEYESLLDECEKTIKELEAKVSQDNSSEYKNCLKNFNDYKNQLLALKD